MGLGRGWQGFAPGEEPPEALGLGDLHKPAQYKARQQQLGEVVKGVYWVRGCGAVIWQAHITERPCPCIPSQDQRQPAALYCSTQCGCKGVNRGLTSSSARIFTAQQVHKGLWLLAACGNTRQVDAGVRPHQIQELLRDCVV